MEKQIRKLLAVLLAVGMSLSLTACMGSAEDQLVSDTVDAVSTLVDDLLQETGKTGIAGTYWTAPPDVYNYYYQVVLTDVTGSSVKAQVSIGYYDSFAIFCPIECELELDREENIAWFSSARENLIDCIDWRQMQTQWSKLNRVDEESIQMMFDEAKEEAAASNTKMELSGWVDLDGMSCGCTLTIYEDGEAAETLGEADIGVAYRVEPSQGLYAYLEELLAGQEPNSTEQQPQAEPQPAGNDAEMVLGGTYVTRMQATFSDGSVDLVCEISEATENSFLLHMSVYNRRTRYELDPVLCTLSADGSFVSDYAVPADGYPSYNWESSGPEYFQIEGTVDRNGDAITITDVNEYEKQYDGSMERQMFTAIMLDGSRFWLGYFHNTSAYEMDAAKFDHTAERIPGSERNLFGKSALAEMGTGLYISPIGSDYYQCNICNVTDTGFDLDLGIVANGDVFSLERAECVYDSDNTYVPEVEGLLAFYSYGTDIDSSCLTTENQAYWESKTYTLMGYLDPNGAVIYVTVVEYQRQADGEVVENTSVDYDSWVQYFIGDSGSHRPQPAFRLIFAS